MSFWIEGDIMEYDYLKMHLYDMNEDEIFYKKYYYAKQQEYSLQKFLSELNMADVLKRNLIVLEKKETIPPDLRTRSSSI